MMKLHEVTDTSCNLATVVVGRIFNLFHALHTVFLELGLGVSEKVAILKVLEDVRLANLGGDLTKPGVDHLRRVASCDQPERVSENFIRLAGFRITRHLFIWND